MAKTGLTVNNQVEFNVARLQQVFGMVMHKLSTRDTKDNLNYIPEADATAAFAKAIKQLKITDTALSFSNIDDGGAKQRNLIYKVLNKAIVNLAKSDKIDFTSVYNPVTPPGPTPPTPPAPIGNWDSTKIYDKPDTVEIKGVKYKAQNWTRGDNPIENNGEYGEPWKIVS